MQLQELRGKIEARRALIGVIGLGYVGRSPIRGDEPGLAELLASVVQSGRLGAATDYARLADADVITINVETPVDDDHQPRYSALRAACRGLGAVMKAGSLVIVESTLAPGTMDKLVLPLLEATSGRQVGAGFHLGVCPERVMPGKLLANMRNMSRVCGGDTPETAELMIALYRSIVQADLDATDMVTAELVKTTENAYRDVQIAFANEVALICEATGADVWRVRDLVNKSPYRQMHLPGAGVGGHCIPKDPWLLAAAAGDTVARRVIPAARAVNDAMPIHMADLTVQALSVAGVPIDQSRVAMLGYAYLENSDDTRNSPSAVLVARLRELRADVVIHDPWVAAYQGDLFERVSGCDAVVVMVGHQPYHTLDLDALRHSSRAYARSV